ncbi:MAG: hypothetical protein JRJ27_02600 [Deltaproteobacteria bacterium]|nr:hypothetical protein [Deltaproteobacteria bacterium]
MDHQSVGLIARSIEEAGLSTVYMGSCRDMMEQVKPPRSAFINFPLGRQCGRPNENEIQTKILKDALRLLVTETSPGKVVDLQYEWERPFDWDDYMKDIQAMLEEEGGMPQEWKPES